MISRIASVSIYVDDQQKALDFWQNLGFEIRTDQDMGNGFKWLEVAPPGSETSISLYPKKLILDSLKTHDFVHTNNESGIPSSNKPPALIGGYKEDAMPGMPSSSIIFLCDDIHELWRELKEKGISFKQEPNKMQWGTYAVFSDDDGNEFVLKQSK